MASLSIPIHQSPQVVTLKFLKATISEEMKQEWLDAFDITIQENGSPYLSIVLHEPSQRQSLLVSIELSQRMFLTKL